ncbi:MAG: EAL domain-containing protein [Phycisphaeraceae bacterium]|nr:MAG: EAL domain-containing protein [Phycisphaeraceae bacterium]
MTTPENRPSDLAPQIRDTIDRGLVTSVFQPIVDLERAGICAYEALTRTLPESAFRNPGELFDVAEACDLLWELEMVTRRQALNLASGWPAGVLLFINCTPQVIADERFAETLLAEVESTPGLSPHRIVLEVTERSENQHVEGLHRQTVLLQQHGFQLAIDDVGAGTSGLNRIMLLRPQWLKLDRELVAGIDKDPVRINLVRFLSHFAKLSGVSIIGEGVEREAELEQMIRLGVNCVQGYLMGKPGSQDQQIPEALTDRIRSESRKSRTSGFVSDHADQLARLVRPAYTAEALRPITDVADDLLKQPAIKGVVVTDGGYYAGWCSRDQICRAGGDDDRVPLSRLAGPVGRTIGIGMSIDEALEVAATARDGQLERPLVMTESGRVVGVVEIRELVRTAAQACRAVQHRVAPLTGLPGRVRCEQQLDESINSNAPTDAAFIDLRGLAEYNAVFGFELGDDLIRELVGVVDQVVQDRASHGRAYLGHLGDDRLLLLLPPGEVEGVAHEVVRLFQSRLSSCGISPQAALSGLGVASATATVAVRFLAVRQVNEHYESAQDFMRTEPALRTLADEDAAMNPVQPGYVVVIDPDPLPSPLLLAA